MEDAPIVPDRETLSWWADAEAQLCQLEARQLARQLRPTSGTVGVRIERNGRYLWNFSSNNYLDLATHPHVIRRAKHALDRYGAGAGGSRLITGTLDLHEELESRLAALKCAETALVFSSGYQANLGAIQALSWRADGSRVPVFFDRLAHASIVDAVMLARAPWRSFPHNDVDALGRLLERAAARNPRSTLPKALVVTEGVFSMDGDIAPLGALLDLCSRWGALLLVDDAHGTGVVGPGGAGVVQWLKLSGAPNLVQIGTLSKALGSQGGFVAGPRSLRQLLINRARAFVFDTALAPSCLGAALGALDVLEREPQRLVALRAKSSNLRRHLRTAGMAIPESPSAIIPIIVGDAVAALDLAGQLEAEGFLGVAIRPPTVAPGTSRLRLTAMATHPDEALEALAAAVKRHIPTKPEAQL